MPAVPVAAGRQIQGARRRPFFKNIRHQQRFAHHEFGVRPIQLFVFGEDHDERPEDRRARGRGFPHQRVVERDQGVTQAYGVADEGKALRIRPRLGDGVVVVAGMNREARLDD